MLLLPSTRERLFFYTKECVSEVPCKGRIHTWDCFSRFIFHQSFKLWWKRKSRLWSTQPRLVLVWFASVCPSPTLCLLKKWFSELFMMKVFNSCKNFFYSQIIYKINHYLREFSSKTHSIEF